MLNPEKIWHEHLTDLSTSPVRPWEIQSHFSRLLFIYLNTSHSLHYHRRKQIATVVLQLQLFIYYYLVLPITCIALVLRLGHATGGVHVCMYWYGQQTCWGLLQRLVATWAEFQHSMVFYATDQCRKRLEACINAEGGHSEHLLWHCLPDIPVATHHIQETTQDGTVCSQLSRLLAVATPETCFFFSLSFRIDHTSLFRYSFL